MASNHNAKKTITSFTIALILCGLFLFFFRPSAFNCLDSIDTHIFKGRVNVILSHKLTATTKDQPANSYGNEGHKEYDAIYVMGGDGQSLIIRLRAAVKLQNSVGAKTLLTMKRPGITEFDIQLNRNLTNDEWTIRQLTNIGVAQLDFELLPIEQGVLGTLSEIEYLIKLSETRGYHKVAIVSSNYHTARVSEVVKAINTKKETKFEIYGASESEPTAGLIIEAIKYVIYRYLVFPIFF
jgi:hypothetical protein